jgi:hypothetical protein
MYSKVRYLATIIEEAQMEENKKNEQNDEKEEKKDAASDANSPRLSYRVYNSKDNPQLEFPAITGVVNDGKEPYQFALAPTYVRCATLRDTLIKNNLASLLKTELVKADEKEGNEGGDELKEPAWQVVYMVRGGLKEHEWIVEGVGFIRGPWSVNKKISVHYILTGEAGEFEKCIANLTLNGESALVEIKVTQEQLSEVRQAASKYYPRFLCMNDIKVGFAGHAGLCRLAWAASLDSASGYPKDTSKLYGFTLLESNLNPSTGSLKFFDRGNNSCKAVAEQLKVKSIV